jgi:hypothetical protein
MAAWVTDMFFNFYLVKNHKILNSQKPLVLEKKRTDLESLELWKFLNVGLAKFKAIIFYLIKLAMDCL